MSIRVLTRNGIENTNIDGARAENFNAGKRSGVLKGVLEECRLTAYYSRTIEIRTGELRLCGHRIVIDSPESFTISSVPATLTHYSLIAKIVVENNQPTFSFESRVKPTQLIQNDLDKTINGTYEIELGHYLVSGGLGNISGLNMSAPLLENIAGNSDIAKVEANPTDTATEELKKLKVGETTYSIPEGSGGSEIDLSAYQTKTDDALETESKEVVGAINEVNEKLIRTLDTTPTETTEGYVGEIVQVSDGTGYQCTAVADGVYTWEKIIKQTDNDLETESKEVVGAINEVNSGKLDKLNITASAIYAYTTFKGTQNYKLIATTNNLFSDGALAIYFSKDSQHADSEVTFGKLITSTPTKPYHCATKKYVDDNKGTKWYKHTISQSNSYDPITGNQLASMLTCYSTKSTAFTNLETDLIGAIFESTESSVYDYGDGVNWLVILGVVRPNGFSKLHFYGIKSSLFNTETLTNQTIEFVPVENIFPDLYDDNPFVDTVTEL